MLRGGERVGTVLGIRQGGGQGETQQEQEGRGGQGQTVLRLLDYILQVMRCYGLY